MDYEKKYKEAIARAKEKRDEYKRLDGEESFVQSDIEYIFPELKESNDERIRKWLISVFSNREKDLIGQSFGDITVSEVIAWLEKQSESQDKGEISDGYHTFNELYYYRMLYNAAFFNMLPKEWVHKSKKHHDGEECFGGDWFIVMANLPTGQISNHYELKDWDLFQIPEKEVADKWDGHTPQEAADRLHKYLLEKQGEQKSIKNIMNVWKDMRLEVYQQASGNRYEPNYSDDTTKMFSLNDIDEIFEKVAEKQGEKPRYNIGDVLCDKSCTTLNKDAQPNFEIIDIRDGMYICDKGSFPISQQDEYELVAKKIEQKSTDNDMKEALRTEYEKGRADAIAEMQKGWSEEDEEMINDIISNIHYAEKHRLVTGSRDSENEQVNWLKSIKERMKGK